MQDFKISVITVVHNAQNTIERCITSVLRQQSVHIQYIIIDGGSTDNTLKIIDKYRDRLDVLVSEPDKGIYDAMNKGIALASGDVIGTLNADDYYPDEHILNEVKQAFCSENACIVYGDLDYIDQRNKIIRKWRSGKYKSGMFNSGWMPPHPAFFCKRVLFEQLGAYDLDYGSAADYELMLRFIHHHKTNAVYLNKVMVKMAMGGVSNRSIGNRFKAMRNDLKAMRNNHIWCPLVTIFLKPLRKVSQFF